MKRSVLTRLSFAVVLMIAAPLVANSEQVPRYEHKKHAWELGTEISYRKYREPDVMQQKGWMYGLAGSYTYHDKLMLKAEARGNFGDVEYVGGTMGGTYLSLNNIPEYMLEARGLIGYDFNVWQSTVLTYFTGLGYRYLTNDIHKVYSGGYERESNYIYSPLGLALKTNLGNGWSVEETAELDYLWRGEQKSHLSDASPLVPDISNTQKEGYGFRAAVTAEKRCGKIDFEAGAFFRYWNIKDSEIELRDIGGVTYMFWEPKNETTEVGVMLGVKF